MPTVILKRILILLLCFAVVFEIASPIYAEGPEGTDDVKQDEVLIGEEFGDFQQGQPIVDEQTEDDADKSEQEKFEQEKSEQEESDSEESENEDTADDTNQTEDSEAADDTPTDYDISIADKGEEREEAQSVQGGVRVKVPQIFQSDYENVPYGSKSVATSGCTITCISMIGSYITGTKIYPDDLAPRFRNADGSHLQRMEAIATIYDLVFTKTMDLWDVVDGIRQGKPAIILLERNSPLTGSQHTVVVYGITADNKILIHDPLKSNYEKSELKEGFAEGFSIDFLTCGFGGGWIFELDMDKRTGDGRYSSLNLSEEDKDLLAKLIWREARGESFEGQQAVAEVVLNRMLSKSFPDTVRGVIFAEDQFTTAKYMSSTTADELQYKMIERALHAPNVIPLGVTFFARHQVNEKVWRRIGKHVFCYGPG